MNRLPLTIIVYLVLPFVFLYPKVLHAEPQRFAPQALQQNGKITLTPSFTPDGKTIYFAQSECTPIWDCPQRLKKSELTARGWSTPMFVKLPTKDRVDWPAVAPNGKSLIFSWAAPREDYEDLDISENFDLYTLDLTDPTATPKPIRGADINRPRAGKFKTLRYVHNEGYPSITTKGDLYFMTERLDGAGERDIYMAPAHADGLFKTARPLPAPINTAQRDDGVWVNAAGNLMLLTYANRGGQGSADIFISRFSDGEWLQPINLGPSINSAYADFGAKLSADGKDIVFTSDRPVDGQPTGLLQVWIAPLPNVFEDE